MKKVVIVGYKSFIGDALKQYLNPAEYSVSCYDTMWIDPEIFEFYDRDIVIMAAGMEPCRAGQKNPDLYRKTNSQLAWEIAVIAKQCGVKQFVLLSTTDIYGTKVKNITEHSEAAPETDYAKSKLRAEQRIMELASDDFCVSVLRFPVVKGKKQNILKAIGNIIAEHQCPRRKERISVELLCKEISQAITDNMNGLILVG